MNNNISQFDVSLIVFSIFSLLSLSGLIFFIYDFYQGGVDKNLSGILITLSFGFFLFSFTRTIKEFDDYKVRKKGLSSIYSRYLLILSRSTLDTWTWKKRLSDKNFPNRFTTLKFQPQDFMGFVSNEFRIVYLPQDIYLNFLNFEFCMESIQRDIIELSDEISRSNFSDPLLQEPQIQLIINRFEDACRIGLIIFNNLNNNADFQKIYSLSERNMRFFDDLEKKIGVRNLKLALEKILDDT